MKTIEVSAALWLLCGCAAAAFAKIVNGGKIREWWVYPAFGVLGPVGFVGIVAASLLRRSS